MPCAFPVSVHIKELLFSFRVFSLFSHTAFPQGYQFWCRADVDGSFYIRNIVTGNYNLYAWVPGFIGDYKLDATLTIASGKHLQLAGIHTFLWQLLAVSLCIEY
jgi:hypothetical protein